MPIFSRKKKDKDRSGSVTLDANPQPSLDRNQPPFAGGPPSLGSGPGTGESATSSNPHSASTTSPNHGSPMGYDGGDGPFSSATMTSATDISSSEDDINIAEMDPESKKARKEEKRRRKKERAVERKLKQALKKEEAKEVEANKKQGVKIIRVRLNDAEFKMKVYEGTPGSDITYAIRQELNIPMSQEVRCTDERNNTLAVSSKLPYGTTLFIQRTDQPSSRKPINSEMAWCWNVHRMTNKNQSLSDDSLCLSQSQRTGYGGIAGTRPCLKGKFWWAIKFEPLQEGVCGGVMEHGEVITGENRFLHPMAFSETVLAGANEQTVVVGFALNMNTRELRVYNLNDDDGRKVIKASFKYTDLPKEVFPAIGIKHITRATLLTTTRDKVFEKRLLTSNDGDIASHKLAAFTTDALGQ